VKAASKGGINIKHINIYVLKVSGRWKREEGEKIYPKK
jgi:hypothetical protein